MIYQYLSDRCWLITCAADIGRCSRECDVDALEDRPPVTSSMLQNDNVVACCQKQEGLEPYQREEDVHCAISISNFEG